MCAPSPAPWSPLKVTYNCLLKWPNRGIPCLDRCGLSELLSISWSFVDGVKWGGVWREMLKCAPGDGLFLSLIFLLESHFLGLYPDNSSISNEKTPAKSAPGITYLSSKQKHGSQMGLGLSPLCRGDQLCLARVSGRKLVFSQAKWCW